MSVARYLTYIFKEINAPLPFKITYALEKFIKIPVLAANRIFKTKIPLPYLLKQDYTLENELGKWRIKAKSDYDYTVNPLHESGLKEIFKDCEGIFLDVGAHIGKWSIVAGHAAQKVYAFEPTPEPYKYLVENISLNGMRGKVIPVQKGVSSVRGDMTFEISASNSSMSKIVENSRGSDTLTIPTVSIDEFLKDENIAPADIELVKIDVEGHEFEVLRGMANLLAEARNIRIICEILPDQDQKQDIINWMEQKGFKTRPLSTQNDFLFVKCECGTVCDSCRAASV